MNSPLASLMDQDLFDLVRAISQEYEVGTLEFLEAHVPSLRGRLDSAEEEVGRLRAARAVDGSPLTMPPRHRRRPRNRGSG